MLGFSRDRLKGVDSSVGFARAVKVTTSVLSYLERLLKLKVSITFEEQIPKDTPILFVANHFTRFETFLVPYLIKKHTSRYVRSLADKDLFVGFLGGYLDKLKVVSTGDPKRDEYILTDLVTAKNDWLIYPEGKMVKDKKVFISKNLNGENVSAKTGFSVLAVQAELKRLSYIETMGKESGACLNSVHVVPVSITYSPIRPVKNKIESIAMRFLKKIPPRVLEELRIEGSILLHSNIDIHFGKPINVSEVLNSGVYQMFSKVKYLETYIESVNTVKDKIQEKVQSAIVSNVRYKLTNMVMEKIYHNIVINLDHIFAATVYDFVNIAKLERVSLQRFRDVLLMKIFTVYTKNLYRFDKSFADPIALINSGAMRDMFSICAEQSLLNISDNVVVFNVSKLSENFDLHKIRLNNILKVFYNEFCYFKQLKNSIEHFAKMDNLQLSKLVSKTVQGYDLLKFERDYSIHYILGESKPKSICSPRFIAAKNGSTDVGVVISHGYKSAPEEVRLLGEYLSERGVNVYLVRLDGHGTSAKNMKHITWNNWEASYNIGFEALSRVCKKVFLCGFSTGGLLSLLHASKANEALFVNNIDGVICINAALKISDIKFKFVRFVASATHFIEKFKDMSKYDFVTDMPENPHINYSKNYLNGLNELSKLIEECKERLPLVTQRALIIQADKDPVVSPSSADEIYSSISSKLKEIKMIDAANHVIVRGSKRSVVFEAIFEFIIKSTFVS